MMARKPYCWSAHGACSRDEAGAEVLARQQHRCACIVGVVQDEVGVGRAVVVVAPRVEEQLTESHAVDLLQEACGDDLVGIDVDAVERQRNPAVRGESVHLHLPHVHEVAGDGGCRGHGGADEVRAPSGALPSLEVAVGGRSAALARDQHVGVHAEAH